MQNLERYKLIEEQQLNKERKCPDASPWHTKLHAL